MENEMIERVARAVQPLADPGGDWTTCEDIARAAIEAMREPTEVMMGEAGRATGYEETAALIYRTMINAALGQLAPPRAVPPGPVWTGDEPPARFGR